MKRYFLAGAAALLAGLGALPAAAAAQSGLADVIMAGRANGVQPSPDLYEFVEGRADAFEFRHGWKKRMERVAARRASAMRSAAADGVVTSGEFRQAGAALDGTFRMPVILARYNDVAAPYAGTSMQDRLFGAGMGQYSLTELYDEMSNGVFDFNGTVIGWTDLPQPRGTYETTTAGVPDIFGNVPQFLRDALAGADTVVDFGQYDNDGPDGVPNSGDDDGYVDTAAFMFPGVGAECGGGATGIWAHRYYVGGWGGGNYVSDDPAAGGGMIRVADYIIQGGLNCQSTIQDIGVVAHEAGHAFGLPDFYDTDGNADDGQGVGHWGLMGAGNWNEPSSPAHMMAFSKNMLGWISVVTLSANQTGVVLPPIMTDQVAYRIDVPNKPHEYFLLENRRALGSDQHVAGGGGLLVWHVDSLVYASKRNINEVNNDPLHKAVDLEESDGRNDLDLAFGNGGNRGDSGDPFPGALNRTVFDATSSPNSGDYDGNASGIVLSNIASSGSDIVFDLQLAPTFAYGDVTADDAIDTADVDLLMAYANAETGLDETHIDRGDVDDDGDVDLRDAFIVHAFVLGKNVASFRVGNLGVAP